MSAAPEIKHPTSVEPPPPDLFTGAAAAGAAVARPEAPTTCCGRYLYLAPIIAVVVCVIVATGFNLALAEGEPIPFVPTLPPYTEPPTTTKPDIAPAPTVPPTTTAAPV